eukprot:145156_1
MSDTLKKLFGFHWCSPVSNVEKGKKGDAPNRLSREGSLSNIALFNSLTPHEKQDLAKQGEVKVFKDGAVILEEGKTSDCFYTIEEGEAEVQNHGKTVNVLRKGDYFGEMSVLHENMQIPYTVVAKGKVIVAFYSHSKFEDVVGKGRINNKDKRVAVSAEQRFKSEYKALRKEDAQLKKRPSTKQFLLTTLTSNAIFAALDDSQIASVVYEMEEHACPPGEVLMREGDEGDSFYVVEKGEFEVLRIINGQEAKLQDGGPGSCIGELALMHNAPRNATIKFVTDGVVWSLPRRIFREVLARQQVTLKKEYLKFLRTVKIFESLSAEEMNKLSDALDSAKFKAGETIFNEGDEGDKFYILVEGECRVDRLNPESNEVEEIDRLDRGDYFGELALLENKPRSAAIVAESACRCAYLNASEFAELIGPLKQNLLKDTPRSRKYSTTGTKESVSSDSAPQPASEVTTAPKAAAVKLEDLNELGYLGSGAFGMVTLVRDMHTEKLYALKRVLKGKVVKCKQEGHIMSERSIMAGLQHEFLLNLHCTFQDKDYVYFLMDACLGGEMFTVLRARNQFDEDTAKFYVASLVEVIDCFQQQDVVYRDLKPENVLFDDTGYIKLCDLGFAKRLDKTGRTYTLCGTPDFLPPEIVMGMGHGKGVDWWTLGIITYEMLVSYPPFYAEDNVQIYRNIVSGKISFPRYLSSEATSFISGLLKQKPTKRLGIIQGGADRIREHPWFQGFDWQALRDRKLPAPIKVRVRKVEEITMKQEALLEAKQDELIYGKVHGDMSWAEGF